MHRLFSPKRGADSPAAVAARGGNRFELVSSLLLPPSLRLSLSRRRRRRNEDREKFGRVRKGGFQAYAFLLLSSAHTGEIDGVMILPLLWGKKTD